MRKRPGDRATPTTSARPVVQQGHQVFRTRENEDVGLVGVPILGRPCVRFPRNGGQRKAPTIPKGPFPTAESYVSANRGPNRNRSGDVRIGIVIEPVPVTGFAATSRQDLESRRRLLEA